MRAPADRARQLAGCTSSPIGAPGVPARCGSCRQSYDDDALARAAGFNVETVEYKNISFTVWDVGGQDKVSS